MPRGGARPGAGRKPKLVIDNTVPAQPKKPEPARPLFSLEAVQAILDASNQLARSARNKPRTMDWNPYAIRPDRFGPISEHIKKHKPQLAMDQNGSLTSANGIAVQAWMAGGGLGNAASEGLLFLGYPFLSELAQRPEYRLLSEIRAEEMVRRWMEFRGTDDESTKEKDQPKDRNNDDDESDQLRKKQERPNRTDTRNKEIEAKIKELKDFGEELKLRAWFKTAAAEDHFMGISHLYLDMKGADVTNPQDPELKSDIGNGRNDVTKAKLGGRRNFLQALRTIEAIWCYPTVYNANNPLIPSWYDPQVWYVMGTEIYKSRLLPFIGRPVPDILKPAYAFGGLSMSQMAMPYVDIWLRTRESVGEIIHAFSVMILSTKMATTTMPGGSGGGNGDVLARMALANLLRDNQGMMVIDKETEDFKNIAAPISGLEGLQAQSQEHLASVARIPGIKLFGIQPTGLNASSEGEMRAFNDTIHGAQEHLFRSPLTTVTDLMQMSLWGERDPDITYDFLPLQELTPKEKAEVRKLDAETDQIRIDSGVVWQEEVREKLVADPESGFEGLDPEDVPDLLVEEEQGSSSPKVDGRSHKPKKARKHKGKMVVSRTSMTPSPNQCCGGIE